MPRITLYSFQNFKRIVGAYGNEVTPVPIPNTEVKLIYVDDTWLVTARETKSVPTLLKDCFLQSFFIFNSFRFIKEQQSGFFHIAALIIYSLVEATTM